MTRKLILATLAYVLPSFPLGNLWHVTVFADFSRPVTGGLDADKDTGIRQRG